MQFITQKTLTSLFRFQIALIVLLFPISDSFGSDSLKIALEYHQAAQFQKALPIFIELAHKFKHDEISNYALCQIKIADIIRSYGGENLAIEMLEENQRLIKVRIEKPSKLLAENYLTKGEALSSAQKQTEFKHAILKSIDEKRLATLPEKYFAEDYMQLARYYINIGNQNDSCFYYVSRSLQLAKTDKQYFQYLIPRIYNLLGYYYHPISISQYLTKRELFRKRLQLSRQYYDSALRFISYQPIPDRVMESKVYHNLGNSFSNQMGDDEDPKTMEMAMINYRKSVELVNDLASPSEVALKDWVIGKGYERLGNFNDACTQFQVGIKRLVSDFNPIDNRTLPPFKPTLNDVRFTSLVAIKANNFMYWYKKDGDLKNLIAAYEHFIYLLQFHQYLISKSKNEYESIYWSFNYGSNFYQSLASIIYQLYERTGEKKYLENGYSVLVSAKYAYLNKNDIAPLLNQSISQSLLVDELSLVEQNILRAVPGLNRESLLSSLPTVPVQVNKRTLSSINLANQISDSLNIASIQHYLDESSTYVDYYTLENELLAIVLTKKDIRFLKFEFPKDQQQQIQSLKRNLQTISDNEYVKAANSIFKHTLSPVLSGLARQPIRLIICPDYSLQDVSWDALVRDSSKVDGFKEIDYLLNSYSISTVLSPVHLMKEVGRNREPFYGIGASYSDSKSFSEIPFSLSLVNRKAISLVGRFEDRISNDTAHFNIIHIASHVKNDSLRPYNSSIYFTDKDSISIAQLSGFSITPNLAILNGCTTGTGTFLYSEGTISFARAFYRLGAQSVLMTLWNVDDKTTATILEEFYTNMEAGNALDASLRQAKLRFIADAESDELANPYYWAGLQLSGQTKPLFAKQPLMAILFKIGLGLITSILILFFYRKRKLIHRF